MNVRDAQIVIVDYGMGNIRSLLAAVEHVGQSAVVSGNPAEISKATTILLPGVGSFPAAMATMSSSGIAHAVQDAYSSGQSRILGICLGMQLLMSFSQEDGGAKGLGLLEGSLERFSGVLNLPVPHVGFNTVHASSSSRLFEGLLGGTDFYFVHSFRASPATTDGILATSTYGEEFVAAVERGNVFGTQFHPEKSQSNGLRLLRNFFGTDLA